MLAFYMSMIDDVDKRHRFAQIYNEYEKQMFFLARTFLDCDADAAAVRAYSAADPLERERLLDAARWEKASELTLLHQFDLDVLCAYYLQLQLAEKWARRAAGNAAVNLDEAADLSKKSQTITKD